MLRLAMNLLRSSQDAYDVYQDTFLRVYRNLQAFRFDCSFQTWLYRIVTNLCLDHLRKCKVRREDAAVLQTSDGPLDRLESAPEQRADGDPLRRLHSKQLKNRIHRVLDELTPRERIVFEMRHYEGLRLRAIGVE